MPRFPACLTETLRWEGGYSDDRYDPGGKTMKGIIQTEYNAYRRSKGQPEQWVKLISDAEVTDIYYHSYWAPVRADEVFAGLDQELFDEAVNSGPVTAVKHLQQCLGVVSDGHIGTQTLDAVRAVTDREDLVERYIERRRQYLRSLKTYWRFGRGWMDRCDGIEHAALAAAKGAQVDHVQGVLDGVPQPHSDADTQSAGQGRAVAAAPNSSQASLGLLGGGSAAALATFFKEASVGGAITVKSIVVAAMQSQLVWTAVLMLVAGLFTYLHWRRAREWLSSH